MMNAYTMTKPRVGNPDKVPPQAPRFATEADLGAAMAKSARRDGQRPSLPATQPDPAFREREERIALLVAYITEKPGQTAKQIGQAIDWPEQKVRDTMQRARVTHNITCKMTRPTRNTSASTYAMGAGDE